MMMMMMSDPDGHFMGNECHSMVFTDIISINDRYK